MLSYLKDYVTKFEEELNVALMNKEHDRPLVEYVKDSWRSLQIIEGIEILGFDYTEKKSEIDINKYIFKRNRKIKQKERFDYKYIDDSDVGLLTVHIKLSIESKDPKLDEVVLHEQTIKKSMLIPLQDEDGYYYINGQKVYLIYQLVEKSTYTAANSVILKSLMPFAVRRHSIEAVDIDGVVYKVPYYTVELFRKDVEIMLLFASKEGLNAAIQFALEYPYTVMELVETADSEDLVHLYFPISSKLYIKVNKELFDQFVYVRSVVGGILKISTSHLTLAKVDNREVWLKKLGGTNAAKGENLLRSTKRLLDATTGSILKLNIYQKYDVMSLTRWICQEYNDLRAKDNMNLNNKRLRSNEVPSSLLTQEFSNRLNRLMSYGKKATIDNYRELFSFPGDKLKIIRMSPLNLSNCGNCA